MTDPVFTDEFLDRMRTIGDPPMDELVAALTDETTHALVRELLPMRRLGPKEKHQLYEQGLIDDAIVAFFDISSLQAPEWMDHALLQQAGEFFRDHGLLCLMQLACASLPVCYGLLPVSEVLNYTGRLERDVPRRIPETAQMVIDVEALVDVAPPNPWAHVGVEAVHKVRLLHALIRRFLLKRDGRADSSHVQAWCDAQWGSRTAAPISQEDLAAVLLTFHFVVLRGLRRLWVRVTPEDERAYLHRWNAAGHALGISEEILRELDTMERATALYEAVMRRHCAGNVDASMLGSALLEYLRSNVITKLTGLHLRIARPIPAILTRWLAGKRISRANGLELDVSEMVLFLPTTALFRVAGVLDSLGVTRPVSRTVWRYVVKKLWNLQLDRGEMLPSEERGTVLVPDTLSELWGLDLDR